jgi:hypothetical protein
MGNISRLLIGKPISKISFSRSYSRNPLVFSVWITMEDGLFFRLNGGGPSFADTDKVKDLYDINVDKDLIYESDFIGQRIIEVVFPEDENAFLVLENGFQLGIFSEFYSSRFQIGMYPWIP